MTEVAVLTPTHPPRDARIYHMECAKLAAAGDKVVLIVSHEQDKGAEGIRVRALA